MSLTFIAGYRNRDVERLKRSLDSLCEQTCRDFDMIVVDYGSRNGCSAEIRRLIGDYPFCRYYYSDTRGWMWNRSAALNTGARLSNRDFVFFTDVDIVYPTWVVERLVTHQTSEVCLISECFRSPEDFNDWEGLRRRGEVPRWKSMLGQGLICVSKSALEAVGALDEQYGFWGPEDKDFAERLNRNHVRQHPVPDLYCYHQWHPHVIYELPLSVQFNNLVRYYGARTEARLKVNEQCGWGNLARTEDRQIYGFIDPEQGMLRRGSQVQQLEAFGVASVMTRINEIAATKNVLWALPDYEASDRRAVFINKVLRRAGWRLDRRLGYAGDVAQGLLLAVPRLFRDYFLDGTCDGQKHAFFLT